MEQKMGETNTHGLESWRKFFQTSHTSIIEVIENAILVAEIDCPTCLDYYRVRLANKLYTLTSSSRSCYGGNNSHLEPPLFEDEKCVENGRLDEHVYADFEDGCNNDYHDDNMSNAMAIENQKYAEVMEVKEGLQQTESEAEILQSLEHLLHIGISYGTLEKSKIGFLVNNLRKHNSSEVRDSAKNLILKWRELVDHWAEENESDGKNDIPKDTRDSIIDQEGVLCHPLGDEGFPMETQPVAVKASTMKSCDDLNGDKNSQECDKRKLENRQTEILNKESSSGGGSIRLRIPLQKYNQRRSQECNDSDSNTTINMKPCVALNDESKDVHDFGLISLNDKMVDKEKQKILQNDPASLVKLEVAVQKLRKSYLQHDEAKKQKRIQMVDLPPLPPKQRNTAQRKPRECRLARPKLMTNLGKKMKRLLNDR